jgi:hypothetical protein
MGLLKTASKVMQQERLAVSSNSASAGAAIPTALQGMLQMISPSK